jgi:hypothetical protein
MAYEKISTCSEGCCDIMTDLELRADSWGQVYAQPMFSHKRDGDHWHDAAQWPTPLEGQDLEEDPGYFG